MPTYTVTQSRLRYTKTYEEWQWECEELGLCVVDKDPGFKFCVTAIDLGLITAPTTFNVYDTDGALCLLIDPFYRAQYKLFESDAKGIYSVDAKTAIKSITKLSKYFKFKEERIDYAQPNS